jgi:hypothetical protein
MTPIQAAIALSKSTVEEANRLSQEIGFTKEWEDALARHNDANLNIIKVAVASSFEDCLKHLKDAVVKNRANFDCNDVKTAYNVCFYHLAGGNRRARKSTLKPLSDAFNTYKRDARKLTTRLAKLG